MPNPKDRGGIAPRPGNAPDVSQERQSRNRLFTTPSIRSMQSTAGNEPLVLELTGPLAGVHWVLSFLSAFGVFKVNNLAAGVQSPVAGLFLCPEQGGEPFGDSIGDATTAGWNINARSVPIPCTWQTVALGAGLGFAFMCQATLALPLVVPAGWTIRLIATVNPGNAAPGPGLGSSGVIQGWGAVESDV